MKCREIFKRLEEWAPADIAWERDNAGLQIGSAERETDKVLLSLDLTEPVVDEAIKRNCSLIITHHPLLFNPIKKLDTQNDQNSRLIEKLIKNDITLYSAHTNLDYTKDGVSFELAEKLELKKINFLVPLKPNQSKLIIYIPSDALDKVSEAIFNAGGGVIGEYRECSFRTEGKGTFRGSENSIPAVGEKEKFEVVEEIKLEVVAENWKLGKITEAIKKVHPYEEPAFDIYPLINSNVNYGAGAVGELVSPLKADVFLKYVSEKLGIRNFRYSGFSDKKIKKAAVCGGSCSEYLKNAISAGADVFITADIKYHTFQEAEGKILLIDAGHFETEIFLLDAVERYLGKFFNELEVIKFTGSQNPVVFYNNQGAI